MRELAKGTIVRTRLTLFLDAADDESFFFGPTLARLLNPSRDVEGGLLCLSVGKAVSVHGQAYQPLI